MVGSKNMKQQFLHAIENSLSLGQDKHSDRAQGTRATNKVYGWGDFHGVLDTAMLFAKYLKENNPEIKWAKEITPQNAQSFLEYQACVQKSTRDTLGKMKSHLTKLAKIVCHCYKDATNFGDGLKMPARIEGKPSENVIYTRKDVKNILGHAYRTKSRSKAKEALEISSRFATRVSEIANKMKYKDIDLENMKLKVIGKGGKITIKNINQKDIPYLRKLKEGKNPEDYIVPITANAINKQFRKWRKDIGINDKFKNTKGNNHQVRKLDAREMYIQLRAKGKSRKEAGLEVCKYLGHRSYRPDVLERYLGKLFTEDPGGSWELVKDKINATLTVDDGVKDLL